MGRKSTSKKRTGNPEKKKAYLDGLMQHFMRNGFRDTDMNAAAAAISISKATLYKYFRSRDEIIGLGLQDLLSQLKAFIPLLQDENVDFQDRYRNAIGHFSTHTEMISTKFLEDLQNSYPDLWKLIVMFRRLAGQVLQEYYEAGIEKGYFRPLPVALMVKSDELFFEQLTDPEFLESAGLTLREAFEAYFEMKFQGLWIGEMEK